VSEVQAHRPTTAQRAEHFGEAVARLIVSFLSSSGWRSTAR
jgi:hypothetical protein